MLFGSTNTNAQTTLVIPSTNEGSAFIGPFGNAARQLQLLIDDSVLTSLVGKNLTSISFRLPASTAASWPAAKLTMADFKIFLSDSVEPGDKQLDFAANVVGTQTQVRSGSLLIPAGALTIGSDPNAFSFKITFNNSWLYSGGNFNRNPTQRNWNIFQICSVSFHEFCRLWHALFCRGNSLIYPNPVKDMLFVKSEKEFTSYSIYTMAGQMVFSEKISGATSVNVSRLPVGNYLLKLTDKNGNVENTQFIKK